MPRAAVPAYLGNDFRAASPGLRFGLLLPIWTDRADQEKEVRSRADARSNEGQEVQALLKRGMDHAIQELRQRRQRPLPGLWEKNDFAARHAWENVKALTRADVDVMRALAERQRAAAAATAKSVLQLQATAVAPFATGLGNEHPLENGFAFLNPYGLPYLPGSGVKGVVRRAAQELARGRWDDGRGWRGLDAPHYSIERVRDGRRVEVALSVIDVLFGREPPSGDRDQVRGALSFWDVIPQIKGDSLMVEIMTPHQSHYYQQKRDPKNGNSVSPHDSGQPNPILFLTVPPGSSFTFYVLCDTRHLQRLTKSNPKSNAPNLLAIDPESGKELWKVLIEEAFAHAFEWVGFGAKTAIGYGHMEGSGVSKKPASQNASRSSSDDKPTGSNVGSGADNRSASETVIWENALLEWEPGRKVITASMHKEKSAPLTISVDNPEGCFEDPNLFKKLQKEKKLRDMRVQVRRDGHQWSIERILTKK